MNSKMRATLRILTRAALLSVVLAGFSTTTASLAEEPASAAVKQRVAAMEDIRSATQRIADMLRGKAPYDPVALAASARVIRAHGGETLTQLFPTDSLQGTTAARPAIWDRWEEFEALAYDLETYGEGLAQAAEREADAATRHQLALVPAESDADPHAPRGLDRQPPKLVFLRLLKTCMSCHRSFREMQ